MITLRVANRDDLGALADVLANVRAQTDLTIDIEERQAAIARDLNDWFGTDEPESLLSIIEVDGAPAGRFRVVRFPDRIFLGGIQIHPAYQNRGIGTRLITELIEESRSTGKPVQLDVDRTNVRARKLYERLGFERVGETGEDFKLAFNPESDG